MTTIEKVTFPDAKNIKTSNTSNKNDPHYAQRQKEKKIKFELNIKNAKSNGANIMENTNINIVERYEDKWKIILDNGEEVISKIIINASGPWINEVNKNILNKNQIYFGCG